MAAHTHPDPAPDAPESPLLAIFAALVIVGVAVIGIMLAEPTAITVIAALATVGGFAVALAYLLSRVIGDA